MRRLLGKRSAVKMQELVDAPAFKEAGVTATGMLVSALDEIAWLLNLRGVDDVPMTPVFYAYLSVRRTPIARPSSADSEASNIIS
jgi:hypothetical protein